MENTFGSVLGPWSWAILSLASRGSVLGKAVLGLDLLLRNFFVSLALALASSLVSSTPPLYLIAKSNRRNPARLYKEERHWRHWRFASELPLRKAHTNCRNVKIINHNFFQKCPKFFAGVSPYLNDVVWKID